MLVRQSAQMTASSPAISTQDRPRRSEDYFSDLTGKCVRFGTSSDALGINRRRIIPPHGLAWVLHRSSGYGTARKTTLGIAPAVSLKSTARSSIKLFDVGEVAVK